MQKAGSMAQAAVQGKVGGGPMQEWSLIRPDVQRVGGGRVGGGPVGSDGGWGGGGGGCACKLNHIPVRCACGWLCGAVSCRCKSGYRSNASIACDTITDRQNVLDDGRPGGGGGVAYADTATITCMQLTLWSRRCRA